MRFTTLVLTEYLSKWKELSSIINPQIELIITQYHNINQHIVSQKQINLLILTLADHINNTHTLAAQNYSPSFQSIITIPDSTSNQIIADIINGLHRIEAFKRSKSLDHNLFPVQPDTNSAQIKSSATSSLKTNISRYINKTFKHFNRKSDSDHKYIDLRYSSSKGLPDAPDRSLTSLTSPSDPSTPGDIPKSLSTRTDKIRLSGFFLGTFQVFLNGMLMNQWPGKKGRSLLAYLLYNHQRKVSKDMLMEEFWPDVMPDSARNSLNVAIYNLRQYFRKVDSQYKYLLFEQDSYILNPNLEIQLDHEQFDRLIDEGYDLERQAGLSKAVGTYEKAIELYKGDFLTESLYDSWSFSEREYLTERYVFSLDRLSHYYSSCGKYKTAEAFCRRILEKDACREDIHRRLMWCFIRMGHRDRAVRQFKDCEYILRSELDISPGTHTLQLLDKIKTEQID